MKIYTISDLVAKSTSGPFLAESDDHAKRLVYDAFSTNQNSMQYRHSEDFTLICIGDYSLHSGEIESCVPLTVSSLKSILFASPKSASEHVITNSDELKS